MTEWAVHIITPGGALQQPGVGPEPSPEQVERIVSALAPVVPAGSTWQVVHRGQR